MKASSRNQEVEVARKSKNESKEGSSQQGQEMFQVHGRCRGLASVSGVKMKGAEDSKSEDGRAGCIGEGGGRGRIRGRGRGRGRGLVPSVLTMAGSCKFLHPDQN
eukprot:767257-Hanusia_phi.AAC.9